MIRIEYNSAGMWQWNKFTLMRFDSSSGDAHPGLSKASGLFDFIDFCLSGISFWIDYQKYCM